MPDAANVVPDTAIVVPDTAIVIPDSAIVVPDTAIVVPDTAIVHCKFFPLLYAINANYTWLSTTTTPIQKNYSNG